MKVVIDSVKITTNQCLSSRIISAIFWFSTQICQRYETTNWIFVFLVNINFYIVLWLFYEEDKRSDCGSFLRINCFDHLLFYLFFSIPWKKKIIDVRNVLPHVSTLMFVQSKRNNSARPFFLMFVSVCWVPLTWYCVFVFS